MVGYCGDGINDLPALHAAHVGLAIGASQAVMVAPVLSLSGSVMGTLSLLLWSFDKPRRDNDDPLLFGSVSVTN